MHGLSGTRRKMLTMLKVSLLLFVSWLVQNDAVLRDPSEKKSTRTSSYKKEVFLGPYIVHLDKDVIDHEMFSRNFYEKFEMDSPYLYKTHPKYAQITHQYKHLLHGVVVEGMHRDSILKLPGVVRVVPDTIKTIMSVKSWGQDRINQKTLPLDNVYTPAYSGKNVDVYVVDTGIDTSHVEFASNSYNREVKNIFNAYGSVSTITDGQGHGTHVSGTVGGNSAGISPGANILGVKILSDDGEGSTSDVVDGLEYVYTYSRSRGKRAIVTMSLGGPCESADCSQDTLVMAVESLAGYNIVTSVAAGNEGCNACYGSPNAAPSAINVGASDSSDKITYFSNFGQCIDIFAPGMDIVSACASKVCNTNNQYAKMSGTSMACPHNTGVLAQLLEKNPSASISDIEKALSCDASSVLKLASKDSITRALLLQTPLSSNEFISCDRGSGCTDDCDSNGICLPVQPQGGSSSRKTCFCDGGSYGNQCSATSDPLCESNSGRIEMDMFDSYGDGWTFTNFVITDTNGYIVDNAYDSLCYGEEDSRMYCVPDGCYSLEVSRGYYPAEVSWSMCGVLGGAPFVGDFCVANGECSHSCPSGVATALTFYDSYGDGWSDAYVGLFDGNGTHIYGGTMNDGSELDNQVCLSSGQYVAMLLTYGDYPEEISFKICDTEAYYSDIMLISVDLSGQCTATIKNVDDSCSETSVPFYMFNFADKGWQGSVYSLTDSSNQVLYDGTLSKGFFEVDSLCIPDGCYDFEVVAGSSASSDVVEDSMWYACGRRGVIPWSSQICVEKDYGLCYGLSGCTAIKSYAHRSDLQNYIISHYDDYYELDIIDAFGNIHGNRELCELPDGCYNVVVGTGRTVYSERGTFSICGHTDIPIPSSLTLCVSDNSTECTVSQIADYVCSATNTAPHLLAKIDSYGDGWGVGAKYTIKSGSSTIYTGKLSDGQYEVDSLCFTVGQCYTFSLAANNYADEIIWIMCGYMGGAPISSLTFCVTSSGCEFSGISDDAYAKNYDDDFPKNVISTPTSIPTRHPTAKPSSLLSPPSYKPSLSPTGSTDDSTVGGNNTSTVISFFANVTLKLQVEDSKSLAISDLEFVPLAIRRTLYLADISLWDSTIDSFSYANMALIYKSLSNFYRNVDQRRDYFSHKSDDLMQTFQNRKKGGRKLKGDSLTINCKVLISTIVSDSKPYVTKERVDLALILAVQDGNFQSDASKALDVLQQLSSVAANIYDISIIDILPYDDVTVDVIFTSFLPSNIFYKEIWPDTDDTQSTSSDYNSPYSANSNVPTVFIIVITVLVTCFCMLLMYALFVFKKKAVTRYAELNSESSPMHTHNKEFSTGDLSITVNSSHGRTSDDNGIEMASVGANSSQKRLLRANLRTGWSDRRAKQYSSVEVRNENYNDDDDNDDIVEEIISPIGISPVIYDNNELSMDDIDNIHV